MDNTLYEYCYVQWADWYEIAESAIPEKWDFTGLDNRMSIFRSYMMHTFARLCDEGKVLISESAGLLAFNTGLVTPSYEDIIVCLESNTHARPHDSFKWEYAGHCVMGVGSLGVRVQEVFGIIPQRAQYITSLLDVMYERDVPLELNSRHIVRDCLYRFPAEYLRGKLCNYPDVCTLLIKNRLFIEPARKVAGYDKSVVQQSNADAYEAISSDYALVESIKDDLRRASDKAHRHAAYNMRVAVPIYYPRHKRMSMLLPLCIASSSVPDLALVVTREENAYIGHTVIGLHEAYVDARLVNRMEGDWLSI